MKKRKRLIRRLKNERKFLGAGGQFGDMGELKAFVAGFMSARLYLHCKETGGSEKEMESRFSLLQAVLGIEKTCEDE